MDFDTVQLLHVRATIREVELPFRRRQAVQPHPDQRRGSRFGSAAFAGLIAALVAVVLLKTMLGLTFGPALVVACAAFILTGMIVLRRSVHSRSAGPP